MTGNNEGTSPTVSAPTKAAEPEMPEPGTSQREITVNELRPFFAEGSVVHLDLALARFHHALRTSERDAAVARAAELEERLAAKEG